MRGYGERSEWGGTDPGVIWDKWNPPLLNPMSCVGLGSDLTDTDLKSPIAGAGILLGIPKQMSYYPKEISSGFPKS